LTSPPPRRPRIPELAETEFKRLCDLAGVVSNRVSDDQMGWDHYVQFRSDAQAGPPDRGPGDPDALVQIKSTTTGARTCAVKVSNAVRLAKSVLPCFVLLFDYTPDGDLRAVYVQHVWAVEIAAALKAGRRAHLNGRPLHQATLTLKFPDAGACAPSDLVARLEREIRSAGADYAAQKAKVAAAVGYEEGWGEATITLDPERLDAFVDVMLGRRAEVVVDRFTARDQRFGLTIEERDAEGAVLSVEAVPAAHGKVILSSTDGAREITLSAQLFTNGIPGLPPEHDKMRIQVEFIELLRYADGRHQAVATFAPSDPEPIDALQRKVVFRSLAESGAVDVQIYFPGGAPAPGRLEFVPTQQAEAWRRLDKTLTRLLTFTPADRWPAGARFSVTELGAGAKEIDTFLRRVNSSGGAFSVPRTPDIDALAEAWRTHITNQVLDLGSVTIFAVVSAPLTMTRTEQSWLGELGLPQVHYRAVLSGRARDHRAYMEQRLEAVRAAGFGGPSVLVARFADDDALFKPDVTEDATTALAET